MKKLLSILPHTYIALLACAMVISGMFFSRACMSIGMIVLCCNAVINRNLLQNVQTFIANKFALLATGLFFVFLISGIWGHADPIYFGKSLRQHLPFLILPIGFISLQGATPKQIQGLFVLFIVCLFCGTIYSMCLYLPHKAQYDLQYGYSHVMPTPFKKDHIRFSMAVTMAIGFCMFLWQFANKNIYKIMLASMAVWLIIYLHILAVKTGLLCFYLLLFTLFIYFIVQHKKYKLALSILTVIVLIPIIMFRYSVTFQKKLYYLRYSYEEIKGNRTTINTSEGGRIISYQTAWGIIKNNCLLGVGVGNVKQVMQQAYKTSVVNYQPNNVLLPHNQVLVMGLVAGVLGMLYYIVFLFYPLYLPNGKNILFLCFWEMMFVAAMVEPLDETQYGVCIHLFFLLLLNSYTEIVNKTIVPYTPKNNVC